MSEPGDPGPCCLRREVPAWRYGVAHVAKMSKSHNPSGKRRLVSHPPLRLADPSADVTKTSRPLFSPSDRLVHADRFSVCPVQNIFIDTHLKIQHQSPAFSYLRYKSTDAFMLVPGGSSILLL